MGKVYQDNDKTCNTRTLPNFKNAPDFFSLFALSCFPTVENNLPPDLLHQTWKSAQWRSRKNQVEHVRRSLFSPEWYRALSEGILLIAREQIQSRRIHRVVQRRNVWLSFQFVYDQTNIRTISPTVTICVRDPRPSGASSKKRIDQARSLFSKARAFQSAPYTFRETTRVRAENIRRLLVFIVEIQRIRGDYFFMIANLSTFS